MTENSPMPEYSRLEGAMDATGLDLGASEIHGVISGLICAGPSRGHVEWMEALFEDRPWDDPSARAARELIGRLYFATRELIANEDLSFMPFLPDDSQPITARAKGLRDWCEGYLYGLGMAGISAQRLAGDAKDALQDISHFTRLDYESLDSGEATEQAYSELQEFLKIVTLLIWGALAENRESDHVGE
ncbi:MAG: UPF0149 family protein [Candidatus Thiodiazotropha sp. (ex Epidulcina cf. delphinae)]|nr:UPF0149 family protein [Candidatus Thiodiazotropha sp. (ex Epidulcina cf. delphinae)]